MARRRRPRTELEARRLVKRRNLAALLADSLPNDRGEWCRIVTKHFGPEAGRFADAVFPDRDELLWMLSSEPMATVLQALDGIRSR